MAIGDFENELPKQATRGLTAYSSSWWDMRNAAQILHARTELGQDPAHYFARRGLLDGAVITYARCFAKGRRTALADLGPLVAELASEQLEVHQTVMWWRDKHVGHRVDPDLEWAEVRLLWGNWRTNAPTIRARLATQVRPDDSDFEQRFEQLAEHLANRIWEQYLYPLQQELFEELGVDAMRRMKASASPYAGPKLPTGTVMVTMDIGSAPSPQADA